MVRTKDAVVSPLVGVGEMLFPPVYPVHPVKENSSRRIYHGGREFVNGAGKRLRNKERDGRCRPSLSTQSHAIAPYPQQDFFSSFAVPQEEVFSSFAVPQEVFSSFLVPQDSPIPFTSFLWCG